MDISKLLQAIGGLIKYRRDVYQFLNFRANDKLAFDGSVQPDELEFLHQLVTQANELEGDIIEVGTLYGFTTQYLAEWKRDDKPLVTIDNFRWNPVGMSAEAHESFTKRNLHYLCENTNTQIFSGANTEYYRAHKGKPAPALVFIDAGHSYEDVMVDIKGAQDMGVQIITGHDYSDGCPGVIKAVDECFGSDKIVVGSLWAHYPK